MPPKRIIKLKSKPTKSIESKTIEQKPIIIDADEVDEVDKADEVDKVDEADEVYKVVKGNKLNPKIVKPIIIKPLAIKPDLIIKDEDEDEDEDEEDDKADKADKADEADEADEAEEIDLEDKIKKPIETKIEKPIEKKIEKPKAKSIPITVNSDDNEVSSNKHTHSKPKKISASNQIESSFDMFGDDDVDFRYIMMNYDYTKNKTTPKITKFERALLIGKRAKQIEEGANPNVKVLAGQGAIEIAEEELRQRKIPLIIKRPNGNTFEYWKPADMEVLMD